MVELALALAHRTLLFLGGQLGAKVAAGRDTVSAAADLVEALSVS